MARELWWNARAVFLVHLAVSALCVEASTNSSQEHQLRRFVFTDYDKNVRPVLDPTKATDVEFGIDISKLVKVDSKKQLMTTSLWIKQVWKNPFVTWQPAKFGGIKWIFVNAAEIWVPDIVLYNNGDESISLAGHVNKFQTAVIVKYDGTNTWMSPATFTSTCPINVRLWPFDVQKCSMTFGSWTMHKSILTLTPTKSKASYAESYITDGDWEIVRLQAARNEHTYSCCANTFSDITFSVTLRRKPLYYALYLIAPCVILALLTLAGFHIPIESGERVGFNVTILLGMSVYLLLIASYLPETSDEVPLLGVYFIVTLGGMMLALFATIVVLKIHFGKWKLCRRKRCAKKCAPADNKDLRASVQMDMQSYHSKASEPAQDETVEGHEGDSAPRALAAKVDAVFFWVFLVFVIASFAAIYGNATERDKSI